MTTRLVITLAGHWEPINAFADYDDRDACRIAAAVEALGHRVDVRRVEASQGGPEGRSASPEGEGLKAAQTALKKAHSDSEDPTEENA